MKTRYLVVDDEPLARKLIISHASRIDILDMAGECSNAMEANQFLRSHPADLLFLDIQMPEMTGFQFLSTLKNPPAVILTTAHREFALEAFEMDVVDYLLKPISFERFFKSVNKFLDRNPKAIQRSAETETVQFIYIKADRKMHKIPLDEIIYIESLDEYIRVHMKGKVLVSRENISSMEEKLGSRNFVRIHRSFILSIRHITSISADGIDLGGKIFPFGRTYKQNALSTLGVLLK